MSRGRNVEAIQLLEAESQIANACLGPESPNVAFTLVALARSMSETDAVGALERVDQAIAIYDRGNRPQTPDAIAAAYMLRGSLLLSGEAITSVDGRLLPRLSPSESAFLERRIR